MIRRVHLFFGRVQRFFVRVHGFHRHVRRAHAGELPVSDRSCLLAA
jgi:hypothetical protein